MEWEQVIDVELNNKIHLLANKLWNTNHTEDVIPAYNSLLWIHKNRISNFHKLEQEFLNIYHSLENNMIIQTEEIYSIPVCYEKSFAPDLEEVMRYTALSEEEIREIHSGSTYHIFMNGFLPGFVFLGHLDERLHIPRKKQPRTKVDRGSVGIGGMQTGIYPIASPGGWNLIGKCPLPLFLPNKNPPCLLEPNHTLKFKPINATTYLNLEDRFSEFLENPDLLKTICKDEGNF